MTQMNSENEKDEVITEQPEADEEMTRAEKKKAKKQDARIAELEKELADASAKLAESDDKYLRLAAEYDNFRRRSQKEKEGIYTDAYSDAMKELLPVLDNLDRAVGCEDAAALKEGLALILKSFNESIAKMGIEEIKALGETFDPNLHYAVMHVDDEAYKEGEIVEVFQKGYTRGERVIRYAVVKVAN
jgi:molecular chaperone GrpE